MSEPDPSTAEFPVVERRGRGPGLYDEENHPRQRSADNSWRYWLNWCYVKLAPAVCIIIAAVAVNSATNASDQAAENAAAAKHLATANAQNLAAVQEGRRAAIRESCQQDEAMANAIRLALIGFGVGQPGNPAPRGVVRAFRPLGGLKPLTADEQRERCDARVRRGGP